MPTNHGVTYEKIWRYKLEDDFHLDFEKEFGLSLHTKSEINGKFYTISDRELSAKQGYAWDGASGPVVQTKNSVRATLVHDIMCQAMAMNDLFRTRRNRKIADRIFLLILKQDGMAWLRRQVWYRAVRTFGGKRTKNENRE
ncbi:MAG: DUF1353 domain-containing protein [Gammaproteobacteria bacterium]|nr:DUF1353 domain-containing protein [Gammaproteobacteria bacterium]